MKFVIGERASFDAVWMIDVVFIVCNDNSNIFDNEVTGHYYCPKMTFECDDRFCLMLANVTQFAEL